MTELRIRIKDHIKEILEENKEKFGASINFQVNFAIYKYLILDVKADFLLVKALIKTHNEADI